MFRFTIRDVLWATFAAALCIGWFAHIQVKDRQRDDRYEATLRECAEQLDWHRGSVDVLRKELEANQQSATLNRP